MKKKKLYKEKLKRKNFFPLLVVIALLWSILATIVYFVSPDTFGAIPLFFLLVVLALFFSTSVIFENTRRGLLLSLSLSFFLFLRLLGVGNILNFLLILGVILTMEIYFSRK